MLQGGSEATLGVSGLELRTVTDKEQVPASQRALCWRAVACCWLKVAEQHQLTGKRHWVATSDSLHVGL